MADHVENILNFYTSDNAGNQNEYCAAAEMRQVGEGIYAAEIP